MTSGNDAARRGLIRRCVRALGPGARSTVKVVLAALTVAAMTADLARGCGGRPQVVCARSTTLTKAIVLVVPATAGPLAVPIPVSIFISRTSGATPQCPIPCYTTVTLTSFCVPPPAAPPSSICIPHNPMPPPPAATECPAVIPFPPAPLPVPPICAATALPGEPFPPGTFLGGTVTGTVVLTFPAGPARVCVVPGIATTYWSDGTLTAGFGDVTVCIVEPAPGNPSLPRLNIELLSEAIPQAHPGDGRVHLARITNNDPTHVVAGTFSATATQNGRLSQMTPAPAPGSGSGPGSTAAPIAGDALPIDFADPATVLCTPLGDPSANTTITIMRDLVLAPGESRIISVRQRSFPKCVSGSCSETAMKFDGFFADGSPARGCVQAGFMVNSAVPPDLGWPDGGLLAQATAAGPAAVFSGVMPTNPVSQDVRYDTLLAGGGTIFQPLGKRTVVADEGQGNNRARIVDDYMVLPPMALGSNLAGEITLDSTSLAPGVNSTALSAMLMLGEPSLGNQYYYVTARSRLTGPAVPPAIIGMFFDVFHSVSLDGITATGQHIPLMFSPTSVTANVTGPNRFTSQFTGQFPAGAVPGPIVRIEVHVDAVGAAMGVPPSNDDCAGAAALTDGVTFNGDTQYAVGVGDGPAGSCGAAFDAVWHSFTPAISGDYQIDLCGTNMDTLLSVFAGGCAGLTEVACNNDATFPACPVNSFVSKVPRVGLAAGQTYHIRIGGRVDGNRGPYAVTVNALDKPVKIVQAYGAGGNAGALFNRDYVVLANMGRSPIDLNGWSIQYASTTGTSWTNRSLSGVIPAGKYFMLSMATTNGTNGASLPFVDFTVSPAIAMAADKGKVALCCGTTLLTGSCPLGGEVVDFLGYGNTGTPTNCAEGGAPGPTISTTVAAFRNGNGCTDTDNNNADFAAAPPLPRSTMDAGPGSCLGAPTGADLYVSLTSSLTTCVASVGTTFTYTATVANGGVDPATGCVNLLTLPAGVSFVSSTPPLTPIGNTLYMAAGTLMPGGSATLMATVTVATESVLTATAAATSATPDPVSINNSSSTTARGADFPPPWCGAILTTRPGVLSAVDPVGMPGVDFTGALQRFFFSEDRSHWATRIDTTAAAGTGDEVIIVGMGNTWEVNVREGVTTLPALGDAIMTIDLYTPVNNAGNFAFTADTNAATGADEVAVKGVSGSLTVVARENGATAIAGKLYGPNMGSATIQADNTMSFHTTLNPAGPDGAAIWRSDGAVIVAQLGVGIPGNQVDGGGAPTAFTYKFFDTGGVDNAGDFVSADGASFSSRCSINASTTVPPISGVDQLLVVNGQVVVQENVAIPGLSGATADDVSPVVYDYMDPNGDWFAYGDLNNNDDWVIRNGTVLARTDDPVPGFPGEFYDDTAFVSTFFAVTGNRQGDWVIGAVTNHSDPRRDGVLVLNGTSVVARQGDPIDLNGDGMLNDDAFIDTFRDDYLTLADDRVLYIGLVFRSSAAMCAATAGTEQAFVRLQLPVMGACCIGTSCTETFSTACTGTFSAMAMCTPNPCLPATGACCCGSTCSATTAGACAGANTQFAGAGTVCNAPGNLTTPCCKADYNQSGAISVQDIFDFLAGYFSFDSCSDFNGSGLPSVQDIFDFLAGYFMGC